MYDHWIIRENKIQCVSLSVCRLLNKLSKEIFICKSQKVIHHSIRKIFGKFLMTSDLSRVFTGIHFHRKLNEM